MSVELAVIIPTKNEEGNVELLFKKLMALKMPMKVLFIDDASTDKTGEIEEKLKKKYPKNVDVVHRRESQGLGKALLCGYRHALETTGAGFIGQMDGDGQHDPNYLPEMLRAAAEGADVVLGSRYTEEGSVGNWELWRRLTSWGANLLVKRCIKGAKVHDATTGYRIFSRNILEKIVKSGLHSSGYVFQIEALVIASKAGANIAEVPIEFKPRISGRSKLKFRDKKEFFVFVLRNMF